MPLIWWHQLGLVALGGALGAMGRFWLGGLLLRRLGDGWPWGTFVANLLGAFAAGLGLPLVRGLTEAMGGHVVARRSSLGGLAVSLQLPATPVQ